MPEQPLIQRWIGLDIHKAYFVAVGVNCRKAHLFWSSQGLQRTTGRLDRQASPPHGCRGVGDVDKHVPVL